MSNLPAIYTALAALPVLYDGSGPEVYGLDRTPNSVSTASLPCRILLPGRSSQGAFGFVAMGSMAAVTWTILDLLLIKPATQGTGLVDVSTLMLTYCGAYAEALRTIRNGGVTGGGITLEAGTTIDPGLYEYPLHAGTFYHGVLVTVQFREILST